MDYIEMDLYRRLQYVQYPRLLAYCEVIIFKSRVERYSEVPSLSFECDRQISLRSQL